MHKLCLLTMFFLVSACTEDKPKQVIIPDIQLQALQKAKNIEAELLRLQQQKDEQYKSQGL
ncbi:hypothetical protein GCM10007916_30240 [Psychromonas marina]|uniref:Lipoprotein n=1 Tax=Psychromonas marina TaxID=88364 RepID=A0ABQ6E3E6_9GAMM|nr:hypothetical protein [Psychromonas marina]GLS91954.1 hypothetical protein GCM10007916_30240 [Psychromonas marina]